MFLPFLFASTGNPLPDFPAIEDKVLWDCVYILVPRYNSKRKLMKYPAAELWGIQFFKKLSSPLRDCVIISEKPLPLQDGTDGQVPKL
jgi:hypothetical protein